MTNKKKKENNFGNEGAFKIATMLESNTSLIELSLSSWFQLTYSFFWKVNKTINKDCRIEDQGGISIARSLEKNFSLQILHLDGK